MLLEYYLCCWCKRLEAEEEEKALINELDILEKEFIKYKEARKKKAESKRLKKKRNK